MVSVLQVQIPQDFEGKFQALEHWKGDFILDFLNFRTLCASLDMVIHGGFLVQWNAILIKEDVLLLVQHINDDLGSLVCNLFVTCREYSLYHRGAKQRVTLC